MKKTFIYFLFTASFLFTSCELDELPTGQLIEEFAITDANSAENALNGAYLAFAGQSVDWITGLEATNWMEDHERIPSYLAGTAFFTGNPLFGVADNVVSSDESAPIWVNRYALVSAANGVIQSVEGLSDTGFEDNRKSEIIAEAKFLRAYGHFSLLTYYGQYYDTNSEFGVIIRNSLVTATEIAISRSTVAETYDSIISDLDEAISDMPASNEIYYANVWTAKLLKARVLLYKGDYSEAKNLALDIINNGPYQLDNMQGLFQFNGFNSSEVILGIQPYETQFAHQRVYLYHFFFGQGNTLTTTFTDLLNGDPRRPWMVGFDWDGNNNILTKYGQFPNPNGIIENSYAFRLTEAYLIVSEAFAREGDEDSSRTYLKDVLTQGGITDFSSVDAATGADLLYEIFLEYYKNMSFEDGHEWFALHRLVDFEDVTQLRPGIESINQYILPIPRRELERNFSFGSQNPGYDSI
ncbi:RagB/SusD family nutrient uptake outer membrane protein [Seonamhaeicola sp.]|uniref:RagB/SusD family nutrient uptake outer membrane protein n=1 Tax=Seonamhaeicola sp. TaxID=1912245 RepID=UPI00263971B9|nr:RagB/SusD family nutrient uptake outer membrane protein [Seonamhaeicola sp.]